MFERNVAEKNGTQVLKPESFTHKFYNFRNYGTKARQHARIFKQCTNFLTCLHFNQERKFVIIPAINTTL
jgi:hypothetical protein